MTPQLAHRSAFSEVRDGGGSFRALNPPFRKSASAVCAGTHAPTLGEHTGSVLRSGRLLG
jgi:CoA:oxalate CoA-transferase